MSSGFLWWWSQHMYCVHFVENILFESSGDICWPSLPSLLLDQLSTDKRDSGGFFSRKLVSRTSDSYGYSASLVHGLELHNGYLDTARLWYFASTLRVLHDSASILWYELKYNNNLSLISYQYHAMNSRFLVGRLHLGSRKSHYFHIVYGLNDYTLYVCVQEKIIKLILCTENEI